MKKKKKFLQLALSGDLIESPPGGFGIFRKREQTVLIDIVRLIRRASRHSSIDGLLLSLRHTHMGWAQAEEIKSALAEMIQCGKLVYSYLEQPGNRDFYLVSESTRVIMPPAALLDLVGLRGEVFFFRKALDQLGVEAELFSVGRYKSAGEMFQRMSLSEASREMLDSILSDFHSRLVASVAQRTGVAVREAEHLIDCGPYSARKAQEKGLIDGIVYEYELKDFAEKEVGRLHTVPAAKFKTGEGRIRRWLTFRRPQIAVIEAEGMISTGESRRGSGRRPILGSRTLVEQLRDVRKRKRVKAVILRLNTPGGSGLASDLIWREVRLTDEKKPVIASFGNVAASGGYYVAAACRMILASESTLTGSIGVIGGKFNLKGLFQSLGITVDEVAKGVRAGYTSIARPFREAEAAAFRDQLVEFYEELFLKRVSEGRSLDPETTRAAAGGRVWTGNQAMARKLIDRIGGLLEALEAAKSEAGLSDRRTRIVIYTPRRSLRDLLPVQMEHRLTDRILALAPYLPRIE